jgi:Trk K+ transport system NAD-binding subunit
MAMTIQTATELTDHLAVIIVAFVVFLILIILIKVPAINRPISQFIENVAQKRLARKGSGNIITELDNYGRSSVAEIIIHDMPNILVDVPLSRSYLKVDFDINVLMVRRRGKSLEVSADTILQKEDTIVVFGNMQNIKDIFANSRRKNVKEVDTEKIKEKTINEIQIIDNYGRDAMVEVHVNTVPRFMVNKTIYQSNLKANYDLNIMVLKRNGIPQEISRDTIIRKGDCLVIFGKYQTIKEVFLKDGMERSGIATF